MSEDKKQLARVALKQRPVSVVAEPYQSSPEDLLELGNRLGFETIDLGHIAFPLSLLELIPREIAERHQLLPIELSDDKLTVAMVRPSDEKVVDELSFVTGKQIVPLAVLEVDLDETLERAYLAWGRGEKMFSGPHWQGEADLAPASSQEDEFVPVGKTVVASGASDGGVRGLPEGWGPLPAREEARRAPRADGKEILVVEDDDAVRELIRQLLADLGHQVIAAREGGIAIELLKRHRPTLVLLDAMLPGMHGFELVRRLRASRRFSSVPIIMVSAVHRGWEMEEDLRRFGVAGFVEKPFTGRQLQRAVERALGEEPLCATPAAAEQLEAGLSAFKDGDTERALECLRRGLAFDPDAPSLHFHLGLLLGRRGELFPAISSLERAAELDGRDFACIKNLAILYQQAGFVNKAQGLWQRALHLAPDEVTKASIQDRLSALIAQLGGGSSTS